MEKEVTQSTEAYKKSILQDYLNKCAVLGERVYRLGKMTQEMDTMRKEIDELASKMEQLEKSEKGESK